MRTSPVPLLGIGLAGAITVAGFFTSPADAATRENDLRGFCAATVKTSCVSVMDNDEGVLQLRDKRGHRHTFTSSKPALRYLKTHARPCRDEDLPSCLWDASSRGNGVGASFIDVGGKALFYLSNLD